MKKVKTFIIAATAALFSIGGTANAQDGTFQINPSESKVMWTGYKVTGEHTGTINFNKGSIDLKGGKLIGGTFSIDMASIETTDLEGEYAGKLNGHLKSDDFFGVANHPYATLTITKVASRGENGAYRVTGNLTIKKITKEVKFNLDIDGKRGMMNGTTDLKIDRSEFNIKYGSGSFFDNLGDKTIYDEFDLEIHFVAKQ